MKWLRRHFEITDPVLALLASGVALELVHRRMAYVNTMLVGDRTTLYGPLAGVFGSLLGFVIAAFSVVVPLLSNDRVRFLREDRSDVRIWRAFLIAAAWCSAATLSAVAGLVGDRAGTATSGPWFLVALFFLGSSAGVSIYRCLQLMFRIGLAVRARPNAPAPPANAQSA